jgi:isoprenylcysteine carboxyl methyltransferase (ICMT) family protein YpbQ
VLLEHRDYFINIVFDALQVLLNDHALLEIYNIPAILFLIEVGVVYYEKISLGRRWRREVLLGRGVDQRSRTYYRCLQSIREGGGH